MSRTAAHRLEYGDEVNRRVGAGETHAAIAIADGVSPQVVSKSAWLSRSYDASVRRRVGDDVLTTLTASHLEVVAAVRPEQRLTLLRCAAAGQLSVRQLRDAAGLRALTKSSEPTYPNGMKTVGRVAELANASAAVHGYTRWDDRALRSLLTGPNGALIRDLATVGRELASRIEEVTSASSPPS